MTVFARLIAVRKKHLAYNPHFWILAILLFGLGILYHSWPWNGWIDWLHTYAVYEFALHLIGSLFLVPIIYSTVMFRWQGAMFSLLLSLAALTVSHFNVIMLLNVTSLVTNFVFLCIPLLITVVISIQLSWRDRERKNMAHLETLRQAYVSEILRTQEAERKRIALEIHDDSIQTLIGLANYAHEIELSLVSKCDGTSMKIASDARRIKERTLGVCEDLRRLCLDLRPSVLDAMGLVKALMWLADTMQQDTGFQIHMAVLGEPKKLPSATESTLFRITQEALTNIKRHARADSATIVVTFAQDAVELKVEDNGIGFSLKDDTENLIFAGKVGLIGMQARAVSIGAHLRINSRQGRGTTITIRTGC